MNEQRDDGVSRREFLVNTAGLGAASLLALPRKAAAESPPETGRLRIVKAPAICLAPLYLAEALLRGEGFSEVRYVPIDQNKDPELLVGNLADLSSCAPPNLLPYLDAGMPIVALAALHGGCYELFVNDRVRAFRDLKGRRVAVSAMDALEYYYVASMAAYVGLDPLKDIEWVDTQSFEGVLNAFIDGKADAVLAFPPQPQILRAKKIGRVIVNTALDRPWDQYFCCMIAARKEFVTANPVATKRAVRAILKATDICATQPERAARHIVERGYEPQYDVAFEVVKSLSYNRWRTYNPEDSLRFFGVRLHESGLIKTGPQKLIAQGTDWRFLNELKRELKA
jgi:NitT/TauT family transport system substrate-binding protein